MKKDVLTLFLIALLFLNISYPALSEEVDSNENTKKTIIERLDDYNERLKRIEIKPASSTPTYEYSVENDSKILMMAYKNANILSYKLIDIIKNDTDLKGENSFILLTEKSSITDKWIYDSSIELLNASAKRVKELDDELGALIEENKEQTLKVDPFSVSIAGVTSIITLVNLANEVASSFKPNIQSLNANISLNPNVINTLVYNNFEENKIKLYNIDDYLFNGNKSELYSRLISIISLINELEFKIAKVSASIEEDSVPDSKNGENSIKKDFIEELLQSSVEPEPKSEETLKKEESIKARKEVIKEAKAVIALLNTSIIKISENISKLINYELSKNLNTPVIYVKFIHSMGNLNKRQYKGIASVFKSDKTIRNTLIGMNYEIKKNQRDEAILKRDTIWAIESGRVDTKNDDRISIDNKNKAYILNNKAIKELPVTIDDLVKDSQLQKKEELKDKT